MGDKLLLSLIIGGKNDNYQDGWLSRFEFALNYNISCLNKTGLAAKVEVNFVDFFSKKKVADSVLLHNTKAKVNFLETNKFEEAFPRYHVGLALNSGLIKATGENCLILGSDQFMPTASWENLLNHLDREAKHGGFQQHEQYKLIPRKQLPAQFDYKSMTFHQIDSLLDGLNFTKLEFRNFKPSLGAGAGGLLAKRKTYQAIGFFDTSWGGYGGQDNDLHNKISNLHEHTDMSKYGVFMYKLPHVSGTRSEKIKCKIEHENYAFTSIPTERRDIKKAALFPFTRKE